VRGRDGEGVLEHRQDGTANALRTPGGGRGGMGVGAVAFKPGQSEAAGGTFVTEEFAPTLQAQNNGSTAVPAVAFHERPAASVVRRLTPVECCRLQGFPDNWNEAGIDKDGKRITMADSPRYRQLGNAVTVNVANWLARNLAAVYHPPEGAQHGQP